MHRYLRAIGFSNVCKREQLQQLIGEVVTKTISSSKEKEYYASKDYVVETDESLFAELCLDFAPNVGLCIRGQIDSENVFLYEYYFPYLRSSNVSSYEDITIERHAEKESYAGVCDDIKVGVSLIFYLQNVVPYKKLNNAKLLPIKQTSVSLTGLSVNGMIMMPINKNEADRRIIKKVSNERNQLLAKARQGDEEAIESLTLDDMDTYTAISKKIHKEDVFTLVDTYFMPHGVECDQYAILGEIREVHKEVNGISGESIVFMNVECNELSIDICINEKDLLGEPAVGRRFKGAIWLQGFINFP